jgi:hypothetical protein
VIGTPDRPLIPNGELKRLLEELDKGNMEALIELNKYTLMDIHQRIIQDKIDNHDRK